MKYTISIILVAITLSIGTAQTRRMSNPELGRNYSTQTQSRTVLPLLQEADRKYRSFDYEGTLFTLENAVAQNPYSPEALIMRARFKNRMGLTTEAKEDLQVANRLNPYVANLFGYNGVQGLYHLLAFQPEDNLQYAQFIQSDEDYLIFLDKKIVNQEIEDSESILLEELVFTMGEGKTDEALMQLNVLSENHSNSALLHDIKGVLHAKNGNYEGAIKAFQVATELEPDFALSWYNLGMAERRMGNFEQAKVHLDKAIELQNDLSKAYLNRGLIKKILGDYGGAMADLNTVIYDYSESANIHKNRGNLNLLYGLYNKAIDDYTKAITLNKNFAEAYFNRALAHLLNFDYVSACYDFEQSANLGFEKASEMSNYFCF